MCVLIYLCIVCAFIYFDALYVFSINLNEFTITMSCFNCMSLNEWPTLFHFHLFEYYVFFLNPDTTIRFGLDIAHLFEGGKTQHMESKNMQSIQMIGNFLNIYNKFKYLKV